MKKYNFKKVYVEVTNNCNLNCNFCALNKRSSKFITLEEFSTVLDKLVGYTEYLYLHVLGEPLLHPKINDLIDLASKRYKVNITTNGYLIDRVKDNKNIRQLNISLHSYNDSYGISLDDYLNKVFKTCDTLSKTTYIQYRIWTKSKWSREIINKINDYYKSNIDHDNILNNTTITNNIFISSHDEFIWPRLDNKIYNDLGSCYALKDHIAILVNGDIVPCCLDADGIIVFGNIYKDNLDSIISSKRFIDMKNGFKNNIKCEELCKHCDFIK